MSLSEHSHFLKSLLLHIMSFGPPALDRFATWQISHWESVYKYSLALAMKKKGNLLYIFSGISNPLCVHLWAFLYMHLIINNTDIPQCLLLTKGPWA